LGGREAAARWLPSAPRRQRQVLWFLAVVDGSVKLDDVGVGGVGPATGRHGDGRDGEDEVWRVAANMVLRRLPSI
jgi:hypothetical protein